MQTQVGWRADSTSGKARLGSCPWRHKAAGPGPPWARSAAGEPAGDSPQGNGSPRAAGKKSERAAGQGKVRGAVLSTPRSFSSGTRVTSALLPSRVGQSGFSRETWPAGACAYTEREIYSKELARAAVGRGKSNVCRAGRQAGDSGES